MFSDTQLNEAFQMRLPALGMRVLARILQGTFLLNVTPSFPAPPPQVTPSSRSHYSPLSSLCLLLAENAFVFQLLQWLMSHLYSVCQLVQREPWSKRVPELFHLLSPFFCSLLKVLCSWFFTCRSNRIAWGLCSNIREVPKARFGSEPC